MKRRARSTGGHLPAGTPPELADRDAHVWHDQAAYHRFMAEHRWTLPSAERFGATTSPGNRRRAALAGWAVDCGITSELSARQADWNALRSMGLLG